MQCLNIKNPEVAALLTEYTDILGNENAAYYVLSENNGYGLDKAPNGEPSKLFSDLLEHYKGDRSLAIQAKARTYSESFKNWFGESKVVDENGEPLVVYHGTGAPSKIEEFKSRNNKIWFTNKTTAQAYADFDQDMRDEVGIDSSNNIYPVFLSIKFPKYFDNDSYKTLESFESAENDGIIATNVSDYEGSQEQIVVFNSNQIKSIDNQGTFSTQDNNIYHQKKIDESIERVSRLILNKLNIKNRKYRSKDKTKVISEHDLISTISDMLYDIIGIRLNDNTNDYDSLVESINSILNDGLLEKINDAKNKYLDSTKPTEQWNRYAMNNSVVRFLERGSTDLSIYDKNTQLFFRELFPNLVSGNLGKFKSLKQAFAFNLLEFNKPKSKLRNKFESLIYKDNVQNYIYDATVNKYNTALKFLEIVPNATQLIKNKIFSELSRLKEFKEFADKRYQDSIPEIQKAVLKASSLNYETSLYDIEVSENASKYMGDNNKSTVKRILQQIIDNNDGVYSEIAEHLIKFADSNNLQINFVQGMESAGVTHYKFDNSDGVTKVKEAEIRIDYTTDRFTKEPERLLLHEITHAMSSLYLASHPEAANAINDYIDALEGKIKSLGGKTRPMGISVLYGFSNASEFIAEYFSNPDFQNILKLVPYEGDLNTFKSFFEKILDTILSWFNVPRNQYEAIRPVMENILEQQYENVLESLSGIEELLANQTIATTNNSTNDNLYQANYQQTQELPKAIVTTHNKLMESLSRRIKDMQYSKAKDSRKVEELRSLEFRLNQMENDKATLEFVSYMNRDVLDALDRVTAIIAKVRQAKKYGNLHDISAAELDLIKKGYIGFYGNIASNIQNMLDDDETFDYMNDPEMVQTIKDQLKKTIANYHEVVRNYNNAADIIAKENFIAEATKAGSFTVDHLRKVLDEGDTDINLWDQWLGSSQYSNSEMVRLIMNKIANAKNKVAELELERGKMLTDLLSKVSLSKLAYLHERNKDGHKTGFMTRDLNYGQHYQDYVAFQRKLADKLGFGDKQLDEVASLLDPEQLKIWNEENNKWDAKHTIRKFKPEYYELTNSLSEEARSRRDEINMEINLLLSKTVDINGDAHRENLTVEEYNKLQELETKRRNLANPYYPDGTTKVDLDMKIAREMLAYNKKLREKLNYKPNMEKFNKAKADAKKNLSAEKYKLWEERNTVERITEQFWEDIRSLSSNPEKSENQITWEEARKSLLRLYTRENGDVDINSMPVNVKELINTYDEMIADEAFATRDKSKKSKVMDIAQWKINPKFYEEYKRHEKQGGAAFDAWFTYNARYDSKGNVIPASFWRKLVPKDNLKDKYVERIPNRSWAEIDRESPFYDERFTKYADRGESRIPNPKLYDNSKEYKKITGDKNLKVLYDALVSTYEDSNSEIGFLRYANPYKLAQIEGGAWTKIRSKDNVLKGLKTAAEDLYTVRPDDTRYMKDNAQRADGSLVKLIPTRYIKMLDDPNTLTNDIVGSTIAYYKMAMNYKVMSEASPELELALDFVSRMEFKDKKGNKIAGESSKTYDKFKFLMDRFVYGMERDALEVDIKIPKLMDNAVTVSVDKLVSNLAAYTRIQGISQNVNVILTGLITNKIQNRLEAISGIHFGNKELAKAAKVILPSYVKAIASIGTSNNKDKVLCYLEFLGMLRENEQTFGKLNQSRALRAINQHYWYFGHEMTDYVTKGKMALAVAFFNKYNPKLGKFQNKNEFLRGFKDKKKGRAEWEALTTTFFDAFEVKNNLLVIKPEFKDIVDERTINKIRNTCKQIGTRIDTQLTDLDKAKIHTTIIGQLLLIYRNFILVNLQTKFLTKRQFNYSTGMWAEAQWPAAIKYLHRHYFNTDKIAQLQELYKEEYDSLDDFEKGCLKRISFEVLFSTFGFWIISALLRAMADDDRDNWWKQEAAYLAMRSGLETRGNVLPLEVFNMFTTPTAAWSTLQYWGDLTTIMMLLRDPNEKIKRGPYKNMNRFERSLIKSTPLRSIYEAKDPRSKMEYYDNMISIF